VKSINGVITLDPITVNIPTSTQQQVSVNLAQYINSSIYIQAQISGCSTSFSQTCSFLVIGCYVNNAGTVSQISTTSETGVQGTWDGASNPSWTISGTNAQLTLGNLTAPSVCTACISYIINKV